MRYLPLILLLLLPFGVSGKNERYLFYLHNAFLESAGIDDSYPEYGRCEYREIIAEFEKKGFIVISEMRPRGTDGDVYAHKVKDQIDSLLAKGVKASKITVLGTSKGGYIAWKISSLMKNTEMNFVLIGICSDKLLKQNPGDDLYGNILSIYERSDVLGQSCIAFRKRSGDKISHYREIELNTGKKHGFLYKALPEWIEPSVRWGKQEYL